MWHSIQYSRQYSTRHWTHHSSPCHSHHSWVSSPPRAGLPTQESLVVHAVYGWCARRRTPVCLCASPPRAHTAVLVSRGQGSRPPAPVHPLHSVLVYASRRVHQLPSPPTICHHGQGARTVHATSGRQLQRPRHHASRPPPGRHRRSRQPAPCPRRASVRTRQGQAHPHLRGRGSAPLGIHVHTPRTRAQQPPHSCSTQADSLRCRARPHAALARSRSQNTHTAAGHQVGSAQSRIPCTQHRFAVAHRALLLVVCHLLVHTQPPLPPTLRSYTRGQVQVGRVGARSAPPRASRLMGRLGLRTRSRPLHGCRLHPGRHCGSRPSPAVPLAGCTLLAPGRHRGSRPPAYPHPNVRAQTDILQTPPGVLRSVGPTPTTAQRQCAHVGTRRHSGTSWLLVSHWVWLDAGALRSAARTRPHAHRHGTCTAQTNHSGAS